MPATLVRRILDHDPPPPLARLWRDRDIIGPLVGLLMAAAALREIGRRLTP